MTAFYRAVWRWHFFAGLIVLPAMLWLATTGGLYLYKAEIDRLIYGSWTERQFTGDPLPLDELATLVSRQTRGTVTRIERPPDRHASWRVTVERDGMKRMAFVDPALGLVLGETREGGVMRLVRDLHSLSITGPIGNAFVEIIAGWAILLVLSGFYLWWPRGGQRALALRGSPKGRLFWRDLHGSAGAIVGAVILFLGVTGMPWSLWWGARLGEIVAASEAGRPPAPGPGGHGDHEADHALPWTAAHIGHPAGGHGALGFAQAGAIAEARGLGPAMTLIAPARPGAPWLVTAPTVRAEDARVLWLDARDGRVLQDARYDAFGVAARVTEWGIATHEGRQYGEINRLIMLAGCIGVWLLALTAPVLWWRRRAGRLAPPPRAEDPRQVRTVGAIMLGVGALFPLTGATMLAALGLDWARRRAISVPKERRA